MRTVKQAAEILKDLFEALRKATAARQTRIAKGRAEWAQDDLVEAGTNYINDLEGRITTCLDFVLRYPPWHGRHFDK